MDFLVDMLNDLSNEYAMITLGKVIAYQKAIMAIPDADPQERIAYHYNEFVRAVGDLSNEKGG